MVPLAAFYRQLGGMLEAGIPILTALPTVADQVQGARLRRVILRTGRSIEAGQSLHEALLAHRRIFDDSTIAMVRAGQASGRLAEAFKELALLEDRRAAIHSRIRKAMIYPCFVMCMALVIGGSCIFLLLPVFENVYAGEGQQLPTATRMLIGTRVFLKAHWLMTIGGLVGTVVITKMLRASQAGRIVTDGLMLHLPIAGALSRKIATARFARTLSHLVRTGVAGNAAIRLSAGVVTNLLLSRRLAGAADAAARGEPISSALAPTKVLPGSVIAMLKSGEESARSDEMLEHVAAQTEQEVDATLDTLTSLINPLLVVLVGAIVAALAVGILGPIFNLTSLM